MVPTTEGCTDNSPITNNLSVYNKKISARKSLHQFTDKLYVKYKTSVRSFGTSKEKRKAIKVKVLW